MVDKTAGGGLVFGSMRQGLWGEYIWQCLVMVLLYSGGAGGTCGLQWHRGIWERVLVVSW